MLEQWHGRENARAEKLRFLPQAQTVGETLDKIMGKLMPAETMHIAMLKGEWEEIAGPEASKRLTPFKIEGRKFFVEISHPAWISHFRSPQVKKALLAGVNARLPEKSHCDDIVLIPGGRERFPKG